MCEPVSTFRKFSNRRCRLRSSCAEAESKRSFKSQIFLKPLTTRAFTIALLVCMVSLVAEAFTQCHYADSFTTVLRGDDKQIQTSLANGEFDQDSSIFSDNGKSSI